MYNKNLIVLFLSVLLSTKAYAQNNSNEPKDNVRKERMEKIENAKIAFLTEKLQLNTEQSQKFWPIYNQYQRDRRKARSRAWIMKESNLEAKTDQQIREGINEMHTIRQNELNVEKQYVDKFLKVISVKQLATLYRSEKEFTHVLLKKLDDHRPGPYGRR